MKTGAYTETWRDFARRRKVSRFITGLWIVLGLGQIFVKVYGGHTAAEYYQIVFYFTGYVTGLVAVWAISWQCPRCYQIFLPLFSRSRFKDWSVCAHCGLPKGSPDNPDKS